MLYRSQKAFLRKQANSRNVAYAASRGTGKTYALATAMNLQAAAYPGVYAISAGRWRTLVGNVMLQMVKAGRDSGIPVRSGYYADQRCAYVADSIVCFFTTATISAIANFRGDSMRGWWFEEATLQSEDAFHAAESTLREGDDPFLWLSYNRTSPVSWVKRLIEDGEEDDFGNVFKFDLIEGRTEENLSLPQSYLDRLRRLPGHYRMRDYENQWAVASGLVYPHWRETRATFDSTKPYLLAYDPAPVNTQAALCLQAQSDHWAVVDELYTRRGATLRNARMALEQIEARWGKPHAAVLDPAAYDHNWEATNVMHWTVLHPSTKEHAVTIPILRVLLEQGRLRVNPATCPNTAAELYSVVYDEVREKIADVVNGVAQEDHATDALRYVSEFLEAEIKQRPLASAGTFNDRWAADYAATVERERYAR